MQSPALYGIPQGVVKVQLTTQKPMLCSHPRSRVRAQLKEECPSPNLAELHGKQGTRWPWRLRYHSRGNLKLATGNIFLERGNERGCQYPAVETVAGMQSPFAYSALHSVNYGLGTPERVAAALYGVIRLKSSYGAQNRRIQTKKVAELSTGHVIRGRVQTEISCTKVSAHSTIKSTQDPQDGTNINLEAAMVHRLSHKPRSVPDSRTG